MNTIIEDDDDHLTTIQRLSDDETTDDEIEDDRNEEDINDNVNESLINVVDEGQVNRPYLRRNRNQDQLRNQQNPILRRRVNRQRGGYRLRRANRRLRNLRLIRQFQQLQPHMIRQDQIILPVRRQRKRVSYFNLREKTQKRLNRKDIRKLLIPAQDFCKKIGLRIESVEIRKIQQIELPIKLNILNTDPLDEEILKLEHALKALEGKDISNLSDNNYKILTDNLSFADPLNLIPNKFRVKNMRQELDNLIQIHESCNGVFFDPREKLEWVCKRFFDEQGGIIDDNTFYIKLAGDGTTLTKANVTLLNFTFTVINDILKAKSVHGNYALGKKIFNKILRFLIKFYLLNKIFFYRNV
jgi:hypothetical protein